MEMKLASWQPGQVVVLRARDMIASTAMVLEHTVLVFNLLGVRSK